MTENRTKHPLDTKGLRQTFRPDHASVIGSIPRVQIAHGGEFKFVVIVSKPEGEAYLFGTPDKPSHMGQFSMFLDGTKAKGIELEKTVSMGPPPSVRSDRFDVRGGGWIKVDEGSKRIVVSGESETYGKFDSEIVRGMLNEYVTNM
jgi:hypothetical protein